VLSSAPEVLAVVPHSILRLVSKVPYVTGPGKRVRALVTTLGLFERPEGEEEFWLTGIIEDGKTSLSDKVREIKEQCGWELRIVSGLKKIPLPNEEELALLRLFDPQKFFLTDSPN